MAPLQMPSRFLSHLSLLQTLQLNSGACSQCVKVNPTWSKGYTRKGAALHGQRRYDEAIEAYEAGLKIEDSPALRKGLEEVKAAKGTFGLTCAPSLSLLIFAHA